MRSKHVSMLKPSRQVPMYIKYINDSTYILQSTVAHLLTIARTVSTLIPSCFRSAWPVPGTGFLPRAHQMLFCSPNTSWPELDAFLSRCRHVPGQVERLYMAMLRSSCKGSMLSISYHILLFPSNSQHLSTLARPVSEIGHWCKDTRERQVTANL